MTNKEVRIFYSLNYKMNEVSSDLERLSHSRGSDLTERFESLYEGGFRLIQTVEGKGAITYIFEREVSNNPLT